MHISDKNFKLLTGLSKQYTRVYITYYYTCFSCMSFKQRQFKSMCPCQTQNNNCSYFV